MTLCLLPFCQYAQRSVDTTLQRLEKVGVDKAVMLKYLNDYRTSGCRCGIRQQAPTTELTWDKKIEVAAKKQSAYMAGREQLTHVDGKDTPIGDRLKAVGYKWAYCAECVAQNFTSEEDVVFGWIENDKHCRVIMNPSYTDVAVAYNNGFWTMILATRKKK